MPVSSWTDQQAISRFLDTLRELPAVEAHLKIEPMSVSRNHPHDAEVSMHVAGKPFVLLIKAKTVVFPRDVHHVIWLLRAAGNDMASPNTVMPLPLLLAESISPGAKELLRRERVGYYDSGGSLYIAAPGVYVFIDKPPSKAITRSVRSLFTGRRSQVLHAILNHHDSWFGVTELAELARVSPATVSQVLAELDRFDWLATRGLGPSKRRHLREPTALLEAWARQFTERRTPAMRRYFLPATKADTLAEKISNAFNEHGVVHAITHEFAAQHHTPFLSSISQLRVRVLLDANAETALAELGARSVSEGANLTIIEAKSAGELVFRQRVRNAWMASPIQIYLDLLHGEGRSTEMAEHYRKEAIGF